MIRHATFAQQFRRQYTPTHILHFSDSHGSNTPNVGWANLHNVFATITLTKVAIRVRGTVASMMNALALAFLAVSVSVRTHPDNVVGRKEGMVPFF